ncbi:MULTISPECIES: hypothetical protein [unclassified Candidatus Tisiphia]|uniref:hypothetical protein n=1 Tax=unclassified Candidatus Tisiphia TaxID=2996318 RepID=UPI00312C8C00
MQNKSIITFFWHHIKPYKWFYMAMLLASTVSSFYPSANYYAIKLFLDTIAGQENLTYQLVLLPIVIFMSAQVMLDLVWRISNIAEWKAAPYVRRSILLQSYDYVQHHSYPFFQENFTGAISSKIKGILDGYDKFWAEMHYGLLQKFFKCVVNFLCP